MHIWLVEANPLGPDLLSVRSIALQDLLIRTTSAKYQILNPGELSMALPHLTPSLVPH